MEPIQATGTRLERLRELFDLDAETGVLRWKVRPHTRINVGDVAGNKHPDGYRRVMVNKTGIQAHRVVFALVHGYFPLQVDHINGIRDDNRPQNLRAATPSENSRNRRRQANNKSGVKGVSWHARYSKWRAAVHVDGRRHHVGYFNDLDTAAAAVRTFREAHHKEFCRHA